MSSNQFLLRDLIERGLQSFDIPYAYIEGEIMEVDVPTAYQPLFNGAESLKLNFGEASEYEIETERVTYGAQVLDTLTRLLDGDRNTIGHALIAQRLAELDEIPTYKERLNVLNAPVIGCEKAIIYRPIIRFDFRLKIIADAVHSQTVPVFYDLQSTRVLDGARHADLPLQDIEEAGSTARLPQPRARALSRAAKDCILHLERLMPHVGMTSDGYAADADIALSRVLVLYTPSHGVELRFRDRRTKREFTREYPSAEDPTRIAPVFCKSCGRIKTHYYMSHRTGELMCTDCGLLCVGCWDAYLLDSENCDSCTKRRYCSSCVQSCGCGALVCPDHRQTGHDERIYCQDCEPELPPEAKSPPPPKPAQARERKPESDQDKPADDSTAANATDEDELDPVALAEAAAESETDASLDENAFGRALDEELEREFNAPDAEDDEWFSSSSPSSSASADATKEDVVANDASDDFFDEPSADDETVDDDAPALEFDDDDAFFGEESDEPEPEHADAPTLDVGPSDEADEFFADDLPPPPDATGFVHEEEPDAIEPVPDPPPSSAASTRAPRSQRRGDAGRDQTTNKIACSCHGKPRPITELHVDFLTGQYYCPEYVKQCPECSQPTAIDFLEGDPPVCFYCSNKMPINLDPEAEDVFRREVQPMLPFKLRMTKGTQVARSPHHLAYYVRPLMGKGMIVYWDQWTSTVLGDNLH